MAKASVLDKTEVRVADLSDEEVLALCHWDMEVAQNEELDNLLADQREGMLNESGRQRLNELMQLYRRGMVRRAEALSIAVGRGLVPPLS